MAYLGILGFISLCLIGVVYYEVNIIKVIPMILTGWVLLLSLLAVWGHLSFIDYFSVVFIVSFLVLIHIYGRDSVFNRLKKYAFTISTASLSVSLLLAYLAANKRMAQHGDELGCWALEVKTLYFLDGFSSKGMQTTIGYSDYFPGQMLFEWWICHLHIGEFWEGGMYVGYYIFYILMVSFLFVEVLGTRSIKKLSDLLLGAFAGFCGFIILLLLPSVISYYDYYMLSVELLQGAVVGYLLYLLFKKSKDPSLNYFNTSWIFGCILLLMLKKSGIIFISFILIGTLIYQGINKKKLISLRILSLSIGSEMLVYFLWNSFVNLRERKGWTTPTNTIIERLELDLTNGIVNDDTIGYGKAFIDALIQYPLHVRFDIGINMFFCEFILLIVLFFALDHKMQKKEKVSATTILVGTYLLYLLLILAMHIWGFKEEQYLDASHAISSISRYSEPISLGIILFLLVKYLEGINKRKIIFVISAVVILSNLTSVKFGLLTYRSSLGTIQNYRESLVDSDNGLFTRLADDLSIGKECRIGYVFDGDVGAQTRLLQFLAAPRAVSFININYYDDVQIEIVNRIDQDYYDYIYFDDSAAKIIKEKNIDCEYLYSADYVSQEIRNNE